MSKEVIDAAVDAASGAAKEKDFVLPRGKLSKIGWQGAAIDLAANTYFNIKSGQGVGTSLIKGLGEATMWAVAPTAMFGIEAGQMIGAGIKGYHAGNRMLETRYNQAHKTGNHFSYQDTRQAATMRQAAVQAIQGSKMNARNALGGEASLMHKSSRIY